MLTQFVIAFLALVFAFAFAFAARRCRRSDLGRCSLLLCFSPLDLLRMMCNNTVDGIDQGV